MTEFYVLEENCDPALVGNTPNRTFGPYKSLREAREWAEYHRQSYSPNMLYKVLKETQ